MGASSVLRLPRLEPLEERPRGQADPQGRDRGREVAFCFRFRPRFPLRIFVCGFSRSD